MPETTSLLPLLGVVLGALFVGASIPALVTAWLALRRIGRAVETLEPVVTGLAREASLVVARAGRILGELEEGALAARDLGKTLREVDQALDRLRGAFQVASAVGSTIGPAIVAGVQAYRSAKGTEEGYPPSPGAEPEAGRPVAADRAPGEETSYGERKQDGPGVPGVPRRSGGGGDGRVSHGAAIGGRDA